VLEIASLAPDPRLQNLVTQADVFVEGFRPGVAERLGIGPDDLQAVNPRLVYARMTGWGQNGPLADRAGHDINYLAISSALEPIGHAGGRPVPPLNLVGDFGGGGLTMTMCILAALFERNGSGRGQVVDAAMVDGSSLLMSFIHGLGASGMWGGPRGTNLFDSGAPFYDTYGTADGKFVAVGCVEPQFFAEMLSILDLHDAPQQMEINRWPELRELLTTTFKQRTRSEWADAFEGSDACVSPVLTPWEAPEHPHNVERRSFFDLEGCVQPSPAPRFERTPTETPTGPRDAADLLTRWECT
jgi:alpha-methylacyl-CoA racemase